MPANKYPIYVISKGRWESRLTIRALEKMNCPFRVVIEPQEFEQYARYIDERKLLILPFSNLGQGSIPARNWVWEHSIAEGHARHWIMDDNIRKFYRLNRNKRLPVATNTAFRVIEDFVDRYSNVPMAGLQYKMFAPSAQKRPPFIMNTRIYSCILLENPGKFRWRGRYNEDTDLSLRYLKAGYPTILFNMFLCDKVATMTMKGGNTEELYKQNAKFDGRYEMAKSLYLQHPDVTQIKRRWGRWQHVVNYKPFKSNRLIRKKDVMLTGAIDEYGLETVIHE